MAALQPWLTVYEREELQRENAEHLQSVNEIDVNEIDETVKALSEHRKRAGEMQGCLRNEEMPWNAT